MRACDVSNLGDTIEIVSPVEVIGSGPSVSHRVPRLITDTQSAKNRAWRAVLGRPAHTLEAFLPVGQKSYRRAEHGRDAHDVHACSKRALPARAYIREASPDAGSAAPTLVRGVPTLIAVPGFLTAARLGWGFYRHGRVRVFYLVCGYSLLARKPLLAGWNARRVSFHM